MKKAVIMLLCLVSISLFIVGCSSNDTSAIIGENEYGQKILAKTTEELDLIKLPLVRQSTDYSCGGACIQSVLWYFGDDYREDRLSEALKSNPDEGTEVIEMVKFLEKEYSDTLEAEFIQGMTYDDLEKYLDNKQPVICMIQAWNGEEDYDYSKEWEDGHFAIAVGYDKENFYFMDPSTCGNYTYITKDSLNSRWRDYDNGCKYTNAGIVLTVKSPNYDPTQILSLE